MRFARYYAHGEVAFGVVDGERVSQLTTTPFREYEITGHIHDLDEVEFLTPCNPSKGIAMALNYRSHLGEQAAPKRPEPFYKTPNAFIGPDEPIILPKNAGRVDEEAELVVVVGKRCKSVAPEQALDYVLGYTCGLDISARAWQGGEDRDISWWRAKSADTFGPIGPYISTDLDLSSFEVVCRVNGKEVQRCRAQDMIYDVPTIVSFISQTVTLMPGDVIFTGTAGATATLNPGDVVEVEIPGIGVLRNPVEAEE